MDRQDRESELGLSWVDCLMEARSQYLQAKELELARSVTDRLSGFLVRSGFYDGVRQLNVELLNYEKHPSPMNWIARTYSDQGEYDSARIWYQRSIDASAGSNQKEVGVALHGMATIDLKKGDYEAARENFEKAMKIMQQIGDRAGEAATWHTLATIDLNKGDYEAARENFEKAMKIRQQIGDRAGEAATWHALASIDLNKGDYEAARENFEKAMKIRQQIGDRAGEAATWHASCLDRSEQGRLRSGAGKLREGHENQCSRSATRQARLRHSTSSACLRGSKAGHKGALRLMALGHLSLRHPSVTQIQKSELQAVLFGRSIGAQPYAQRADGGDLLEEVSEALQKGPRSEPHRCRLPQSLTSACHPATEIALLLLGFARKVDSARKVLCLHVK